MKKFLAIILPLVMVAFVIAFIVEAQTNRRGKALHQTMSQTVWDNYAFDAGGNTADTSAGFYVGDVYLPSVRLLYKGDDNTAGSNSLDVDIKFETYIAGVGWKAEDHYIIRQMTNTAWALAQQPHITPRLTATTITNPGAGNDLVYTAPDNSNSIFAGLKFIYTTDATVDDRWVRVGLYDGSNNIVWIAACETAQPASKAIAYSFFPGASNTYIEDASTATVAIPENLYMREDYYISTNVASGDPQDTFTTAVMSAIVDVDPLLGYHLPIMTDSVRFVALEGALIGSDEDIYLVMTGQYLNIR